MTATADAPDRSTVEELAQTVAELQETVATQNEQIADLQSTNEQKDDRIDALETALAEHLDHAGREVADVRGRISEVEADVEQLEDRHPRADSTDESVGDATDEGSQTAETPLERICALPEQLAARELTANQERARFIARDARDYAKKAPAGLVITSRAITRVLTAAEESRPHTQTVARVMRFLAEFGNNHVQLKKRRGKKFVVVDPEAADRLAHHTRCDQDRGVAPDETVISG